MADGVDLELRDIQGRSPTTYRTSDDSDATLFSPRSDAPWKDEHDEPLLADEEALRPLPAKVTPLPKAQLAALCTVRLVDPIAFTQGA